jgi:acyl carrier protein
MVPDSTSFILNALAASIYAAGGRRDIAVLPGDSFRDLGLSRLRLLAVLIELEDIFAVEFSPEATDRLRCAGDIVLYIQSFGVVPHHDADDEPRAVARQILPFRSARDRMQSLCARVFGRRFGLAA